MSAPALDIRGSGNSWAILCDGRPLPRHFDRHHKAATALDALRRRMTPTTARSCLCCGTRFNSTGAGNRLCPPCRTDA